MAVLREKNDLDKKWTWYLFLFANVLVLLGCAITWAMISKGKVNLLFLPTIICNLCAIALVIVFMWFESKDTMPKAVHFQKKWLWWYLAALIVFAVAIIFNALYYVLMINENATQAKNQLWILIVYFVVTGVLTLVSIGLQRYARFRIDLDIYRRKRGENPKQEEVQKEKTKIEKKSKKPSAYDSDAKATGGLLEEMDKK